MEKGEIIEALEKWNFWNREQETGIERECTAKIFKSLKYGKVITLTGVRRAGKSYILKQLAKKLLETVPKEDILIINFEEPRFEVTDLKLLIKIYEAYEDIIKPKGKPHIFLDEIQEVKRWEKFVRSLNETREAHIVITGSSAKLLSEELSTVLTGRQLTFEIFPLSFKEFLRFKNTIVETEKDILLNAENIRKNIHEYFESSSFPETVGINEEDMRKKLLFEYYDSIINRDIVKRFKIREIDKIKILAKYYLTNISSPVTYTKIGKFLKIPVESVSRFSEYLQISKLIFFVPRFSFSIKERENSPRKVYCIDNGIAMSLGFRFMENRWKYLENLVAVELKRRQSKNPDMELFYWKDYGGKEVDFVLKEGKKVRQLIQVCYDIKDIGTKERELTPLIKAGQELRCTNLLVITWDFEGSEKVKGSTIKYAPLWKWLLE